MIVTSSPCIYSILSTPGNMKGLPFPDPTELDRTMGLVCQESVSRSDVCAYWAKTLIVKANPPAFSSTTKVTEEASVETVEPKDPSQLNIWVAKWRNIALEGHLDPQQIFHEWEIKLYGNVSLFCFIDFCYYSITQPSLTVKLVR